MDARAEQLVLDYLRRLGEASHQLLGPEERTTFLARSRTVIAGQIGEPGGAAAATDVQRLLDRLGDPRELAARERQRLDAAATADQRRTSLSGLLSPPPSEPRAWAGTSRPDDAGVRVGRVITPPDPARGTAQARLRSVLALVRRHPLETVAVLLLGVGGLIYPFPLWLIGAVAVIASRGWDTRDKWAALAVPVAFALVAAIAIAGLFARSGSLAGYFATVRIDGWDLIRAGSLVAAAYLAWRLRRGRRPRREPPWRRPPRA
jgi:hypothetical protein